MLLCGRSSLPGLKSAPGAVSSSRTWRLDQEVVSMRGPAQALSPHQEGEWS